MELLKLSEVKTISSIGGGPIGGGWTAFSFQKGLMLFLICMTKMKKMFL